MRTPASLAFSAALVSTLCREPEEEVVFAFVGAAEAVGVSVAPEELLLRCVRPGLGLALGEEVGEEEGVAPE